MKQLNICIDIDGTITDPYYWLDSINNYFNLNITESDVTDYDIAKVINIKNDEYDKFYDEYKVQLHSTEKLREDVKNVLDALNRFNNIYFVTARDKSLELLTNLYLKYNKIPFDDVLVLGTHNKVSAAQKLNCDIFIEDSYNNAIELASNGFKVLLMDTNYNRLPLKNNIIRVYDWKEIFQVVTKLTKNEEVV